MVNDMPHRPKRSLWGRLWWWVDGSRRMVLNLLYLAIVLGGLVAWIKSGPPRWKAKTVLVLDLQGALVGQLIVFETLSALAYALLLRGAWPPLLTGIGVVLLIAGVSWALRIRPEPLPEAAAQAH